MELKYEFLHDPIRTVYAVDCTRDGDQLTCAAIYLDPLIQNSRVVLECDSARLLVELPPNLLNRPKAFAGWSVKLPVTNE